MQIYTTKMKTQSMALALILLSACHRPLTWETPRFMREQDRFSEYAIEPPSASEGSQNEASDGPHLYFTAFRDKDIVLFRDFEELSGAPAGDNPDPDRHRVLGGHLWSDALEGKETVVYRDGEEFLRWSGEELFAGFTLIDGALHTLGQRPGDQGFCYRINGREVFSDPAGRIVGSVPRRSWDGIYYCYGIPLQHGSSTTWEYRIMKGADTVCILADDTVGTVLDICVINGSVYRVEKRGDNIRFVSPRGAFPYGEASRVSIVTVGRNVCVRGHNAAGTACWYRQNSKLLAWENAAELYYNGTTRVWWTIEDGLIGQMCVGKTAPDIEPGRYYLATSSCAGFFGQTFCAALTDAKGNDHLVITDTTVTPFHLNGTITSVLLE